MAIGKQLSDLNPDGASLGQSATDKISFYGATPVAQQANALQAPISSAGTLTLACQALAQVQNVLINLGLMKNGA